MNSNRNSKLQFLSVIGFLILVCGGTNCIAQSAAKPGGGVGQARLDVNEQPFDKLELFSFFAAGPVAPYANHITQKRGTNFTPDTAFISSFTAQPVRAILFNIKVRAKGTDSAQRLQAYELARKAYEAQKSRNFAPAGESYRQALSLAPDSATLHLAYAAELLLSQNFPASDEQTQASIKLWPENSEAHAMLALSMVLQKRSAEAETESKEALRIFPQHTSAKFTLAQALTNEHKYKEAVPAIRIAMAAIPSMTSLTKFLGISLMETGEIAAGIEQLSAYVRMAPDDAEGHYFLGVGLRAKGSTAEAHTQFLEAARLNPKNPQYQAAANPSSESAAEPANGPKPEDASFAGQAYTNRFFGFAYDVPADAKAINAAAARSAIENQESNIATTDPAAEDIKKIQGKLTHLLVFAANNSGKANSEKTILVSAIDGRFENHVTAASYADSVLQRVQKAGLQGEMRGTPVQVSFGGRAFWKAGFVGRKGSVVRYGSEFTTEMKGYFLVFTFGAPDLGGLSEIEKSLESIQFQPNAK